MFPKTGRQRAASGSRDGFYRITAQAKNIFELENFAPTA